MLRSAVARSLEFSLEDKKVSLDALARETGERRLVLLLDNCICSTEPRVSSRSYCAFDLIPPL